jgi:hypothetical protein
MHLLHQMSYALDMSQPKKRRLFCYTVVKEFKQPHEVAMARSFFDDLKHDGAHEETFIDLNHNMQGRWLVDDETEIAHHLVEIIEK